MTPHDKPRCPLCPVPHPMTVFQSGILRCDVIPYEIVSPWPVEQMIARVNNDSREREAFNAGRVYAWGTATQTYTYQDFDDYKRGKE